MQDEALHGSFLGVCGVQTAHELDTLEELAGRLLPDTDRFLMAGIKDYQKMTTSPARLKRVRPFIHCDFKPGIPFESMVYKRLAATKDYAKGLQLNCMPWMEVDYSAFLADLKEQYPQVAIMLQAHNDIMQAYTPEQVAERASQLTIDYLFFDPSQSRGIPFAVDTMKSFVDAAYGKVPAIAVAGGLGPNTMSTHFSSLTTRYPDLSCDAFGKLQNPATSRLDWSVVSKYLQAGEKCVTHLS